MAKKSFKDNPALQFLSTPAVEEVEEIPEAKKAPTKRRPAPKPSAPAKPPEGYKVNPLYVETKSRRMQLVLKPSLYERVREHAMAAGISVNEYVHSVLEEATGD